MLLELFPATHLRYTSLPIVEPILNAYGMWLLRRGYSVERVRSHCQAAPRLARLLQQSGVRALADLTRIRLHACAPPARENSHLAALVHALERYVEAELSLFRAGPPSGSERRVTAYAAHLEDVRGLAPATVEHHRRTATEFLTYLDCETNEHRLATLTATDVEGFVRVVGQRVGRISLHSVVGALRTFLRFLVSAGAVPTGLDQQIDTPRVYRDERLPRALPWETVQSFLRTIDRTSPRGCRDYAIFLLIATYGLRACDVAALTLDDIEWRSRRIRIRQRKTANDLGLPLTDAVGTAVLEYLQRGRPSPETKERVVLNVELCRPTCRQVFLRCRRPAEPLGPTALSEAFYVWAQRSGLPIPFHGVHCLRHSYAVHLLRTGTSLKTIGDLLGHRSPESTCVYLRLDIEDLRDVALDFPYAVTDKATMEVAS